MCFWPIAQGVHSGLGQIAVYKPALICAAVNLACTCYTSRPTLRCSLLYSILAAKLFDQYKLYCLVTEACGQTACQGCAWCMNCEVTWSLTRNVSSASPVAYPLYTPPSYAQLGMKCMLYSVEFDLTVHRF